MKCQRGHRRGFTLIEVAVAVWGVTVVLLLVVQLIYSIYRGAAEYRERGTELANLDRLAESFRRDARAAVSASLTGGKERAAGRLTLRLPEGREIEYAAAGNRVTVTRWRAGTRTGGDAFAIDAADVRFELLDQPPAKLTRIVLKSRTGTKSSDAAVELRIDAALSADRRFHGLSVARTR